MERVPYSTSMSFIINAFKIQVLLGVIPLYVYSTEAGINYSLLTKLRVPLLWRQVNDEKFPVLYIQYKDTAEGP